MSARLDSGAGKPTAQSDSDVKYGARVPHSEATRLSYTGPRPDVLELVPASAKRLLDVGCANGAVGAALKARQGAEVWGIDNHPVLAAEARENLDHVIEADVGDTLNDVEGHFDVVICADVLEHLADPHDLMRRIRPLTDYAVISLPNVRFWRTFTQVGIRGTWPRADRGVHDRTHLQWFTDRDARDMFSQAGFVVEAATQHYRLRDSPISRVNRLACHVAHGPLKPFLTYQMLYRLR